MARAPITLAPIPALDRLKKKAATGEKAKPVVAQPTKAKSLNGVEPVLRVGKLTTRITAPSSETRYVTQVNQAMRELEASMRSIFDQFLEASPKIMLDAMEPIFEASQRLTPVDTGELIASGYLESTGTKKAPRIEIGYGRGGHPSYTVFVHERTDIMHVAPTQAKFLEEPLKAGMGNLFIRVAKGYQQFMATGEGRR